MTSITSIIYVALGGALGSVSRYLLGTWVQTLTRSIDFPYGTLTVNLIGCFVIGFLSQIVESRDVFTPETKALVFVGVLGGFTTFSSFGNQTFNLFRDGEMFNAVVNVGVNVIVGLGLVWLGRLLAVWLQGVLSLQGAEIQ